MRQGRTADNRPTWGGLIIGVGTCYSAEYTSGVRFEGPCKGVATAEDRDHEIYLVITPPHVCGGPSWRWLGGFARGSLLLLA